MYLKPKLTPKLISKIPTQIKSDPGSLIEFGDHIDLIQKHPIYIPLTTRYFKN